MRRAGADRLTHGIHEPLHKKAKLGQSAQPATKYSVSEAFVETIHASAGVSNAGAEADMAIKGLTLDGQQALVKDGVVHTEYFLVFKPCPTCVC